MVSTAAGRAGTGTGIPLPRDFDVDWLLAFLGARHAPSLESVEPTRYTRTLTINDVAVTVSWQFAMVPGAGKRVSVRSSPHFRPGTLIGATRAIFDLDANVTSFRRRVRDDRILGPLVAQHPGIRLTRFLDPFEGAARAILGQQVSVAAARQIVERLAAALGPAAPNMDGRSYRAFPAPECVLDAGAARLGEIGLTRAKQAALLAVADDMRSGRLDWIALRALPAEVVQARLEAIRGIGPWTAAYLRMRVLGDRDAFPATDLGVMKAFRRLNGRRTFSTDALINASEAWRPWRAYATLHLWRSLSGG